MKRPWQVYQRASGLKLRELRQAWLVEFGEPPPPFGSRELLLHAFIQRIEIVNGRDLKPWAKKRLTDLDRQFAANPDHQVAPRILPSVGSALVRDWNGARHVVLVTKDGFQYGDQIYASLTQVAKAITGQHRSGPLFFDLNRSEVRS